MRLLNNPLCDADVSPNAPRISSARQWRPATFLRALTVIAAIAPHASAQFIPFGGPVRSYPPPHNATSACFKGERYFLYMEEVEGEVWVCGSCDKSACCRVDMTASPPQLIPIDFKVTTPFREAPKPTMGRSLGLLALAFAGLGQIQQGFGSVWLLEPENGLRRFDLTTLQEVAYVPVDGLGFFIADGAIWVLGPKPQGEKGKPAALASLYRINPESYEITAKLAWGDDSYRFIAAEGSLWIMHAKTGTLSRIDPVTGESLAEIRIGPPHGHRRINFSDDDYTTLAAGEGAIWIIEYKEEGNLFKVDPKSNRVVATIPVGYHPGGVLVGGGFLWVPVYYTNSAGHFVLKIDPRTNQILGRIFLPGSSMPGLAAGKDSLLAALETGNWSWTRKSCIWKIPYSATVSEAPTPQQQ